MKKATDPVLSGPGSTTKDALSEVLREGARRMVAVAVDAEVDAYIQEHATTGMKTGID